MSVRVRFAPSPTGYLHLGGARTALFNWLYARNQNGTFLLRIEDTDRERSTPEAIQQILDGMKWLGLHWDEGPSTENWEKETGSHGPYFQTARLAIYQQYIDRLLESGHLYRCYCTRDEIESMRQKAQAAKETFLYDGRCREKGEIPGKPFSLRIRVPKSGETVVEDRVRGRVSFQNKEIGDWICVRTDGTPTYNFCVVIDDVTMEITHVIRGDDHLNNTPKQVSIFQALGRPVPTFAHLPMILGQDRKGKLSKRHGAASVLELREQGILPEAALNYLARLCWSHGDQEIFTVADLVEKFSLDEINKSSAAFDIQKLQWVNFEHLKMKSAAEIAELARPFFEQAGVGGKTTAELTAIVELFRERAKTLKDFTDASAFFFREPALDEAAAKKFLTSQIAAPLRELTESLEALGEWTEGSMKPHFDRLLEKHQLKMVALAQAVRVSVTGTNVSPPIFDVLALLGKQTALRRLKARLAELDSSSRARG